MKTFKLWLEPDEDFPRLKRLHCAEAEVSIHDVLMTGVHPYLGNNAHLSVADALFASLRAPGARPIDFLDQGLCQDQHRPSIIYGLNDPYVLRVFAHLQKHVYFVEGVSYLDLLEMAKAKLQEIWTHATAKALALRAWPVFNDLRRVLKSKDKRVKLSATWDLDKIDCSKVLRIDDFAHHDRLVLEQVLPTLSFCDAAWLKNVTDARGRLRLKEQIPDFVLSGSCPSRRGYVDLSWLGSCRGTSIILRPDIGDSMDKRRRAYEIAEQWRTGPGKLVFPTTVDRVAEMVEREIVDIGFPSLEYTYDPPIAPAKVFVAASRVEAFAIGNCPREVECASALKDVLTRHGVSVSGTKTVLAAKIARLAAMQYHLHKAEMDAYFDGRRFVRMDLKVHDHRSFPVLEEQGKLRNLLLSMYVLKHLRGSSILDPTHVNETYNEEELALALVSGRVKLEGAFLRVPS